MEFTESKRFSLRARCLTAASHLMRASAHAKTLTSVYIPTRATADTGFYQAQSPESKRKPAKTTIPMTEEANSGNTQNEDWEIIDHAGNSIPTVPSSKPTTAGANLVVDRHQTLRCSCLKINETKRLQAMSMITNADRTAGDPYPSMAAFQRRMSDLHARRLVPTSVTRDDCEAGALRTETKCETACEYCRNERLANRVLDAELENVVDSWDNEFEVVLSGDRTILTRV